MTDTDNIGSFVRENKKLLKEYLETRAEVYRLRFIRSFSKLAGFFAWMLVSLFLCSLLAIFLGLVTGFWLSSITGSYTKGFGYTSLIILGVIIIIALFRRVLFVNPIIRTIIRKTNNNREEDNIQS